MPVERGGLGDLVAAARRGDPAAFSQIVAETSAQMYALALRLTGNEDDARDVVQDAYLRAFRSIRKFRGESHVTTWLYRIVANCAATHGSRRRRRRETGPVELLAAELVADEPIDAGSDSLITRLDERERLAFALDGLTDTLRVPVVLHDVYGLSHEEVARVLGISRSASKVRLHRARRLLRSALDDEMPRRRRAVAHLDQVRVGDKGRRAVAG